MSKIVLKTARRKTTVSRLAVRKAVAATFVAGTFTLKDNTVRKTIKKVASKAVA